MSVSTFPSRSAGILTPIASLRGSHGPDFGIGSLGLGAKEFAEFLQKAGQSYWQILPVGPLSEEASPYSCLSAFAGNPYFIDLTELFRQNLLTEHELAAAAYPGAPGGTDYAWLASTRYDVLRKAFGRSGHRESTEYKEFTRQNSFWLDDYCLFMALKNHFDGKPWLMWPEDIRLRKPDAVSRYRVMLSEETAFWGYLQFEFYQQWDCFKAMLHEKGIQLIGDIPIYVSLDAAEPWSMPECFDLDDTRHPVAVAGVPPDSFSTTGQLWGNPLYNWRAIAQDGYRFWIERLRFAARLYDVVRIDHFRGFEKYYAIPARQPTAEHGKWKVGPRLALFRAIREALPELRLIAEDLGVQTDGVRRLLRQCGYPGMKVLQFAFGSDGHDPFLPHNYDRNCVVYTGTHDNDTTRGFFDSAPLELREKAAAYLRLPPDADSEMLCDGLISAAYQSVAAAAIIPMQDFLRLGSEARVNQPATFGQNWRWRLSGGELTKELAADIRSLTLRYGREP